MKSFFVLMLSVIVLFSCENNNPRDKAIRMIEKYHKDRKIDLSGFSNMEYSSLDSAFSGIMEEPVFKEASMKLFDLQNEYRRTKFGFDTPEYKDDYEKKKDKLIKRMDELRLKFIPRFKGFKISQIYIYPTSFGDSARIISFLADPQLLTIEVDSTVSDYPIPMEIYNATLYNGKFFTDSADKDWDRFDIAVKQFFEDED